MYNRPFAMRYNRQEIRFNPCGTLRIVSLGKKRRNPLGGGGVRTKQTTPGMGRVWGVRMFVGLSVGHEPKYSIARLVKFTKDFLIGQGWPPDSSFVAQRGIYTYASTDPKGPAGVVEEESAQVIILDAVKFDKDAFLLVMQNLAEYLVKAFEQEKIFVQVQYANVVRDTWMVTQ